MVSDTVLPLKITMRNLKNETQSVVEQELFLKKDLLLKISEMCHYLGAIDYKTEFYRRKNWGQTSWEFED